MALRQRRYACSLRASTGWLGWSEPPSTKLRSGPNWASIGLAQEALVGVKHSSTLWRAAQRRMAGGLVGRQVVQDHVDQPPVGPSGADRLECRQGVVGALAAPGGAPQLVVAERVAAVEVADAVGAPVGRRQPVGMALRRPRAAVVGPDRQRPELVEREAAIRVLAGHLLDPVQFSSRWGSLDSFQVRVR